MRKLGVVTIGQAPRADVGPILEKYIGDKAQIIQVGVLDGLSKAEIDDAFSPGQDDCILTSRLLSGESAVMSSDKVAPVLQAKIDQLEEAGCRHILVLCTGTFEGLTAKQALLIEPDQIIQSTLSAMLKHKKLGVIVPLLEQQEALSGQWGGGLSAVYSAASPYAAGPSGIEQAAEKLAGEGVDAILLDCMGYVEEHKAIAEAKANLPVILSNALVAKIVSELF
ncbi:AroM family protein [Brevibacillus sp. B_LB10_24]|uniref:AroM family protein n=1 Tax=Brevibacillus sp. B_LB10_24 TaxID=3380645 RepID=UPI0038BC694B